MAPALQPNAATWPWKCRVLLMEHAPSGIAWNGCLPEFDWTVFTIRNGGTESRELVVALDAQRLAASGIMRLVPFGSRLESVQWVQAADPPTQQSSASVIPIGFELKPGEAVTMVKKPQTVPSVAHLDLKAFTERETLGVPLWPSASCSPLTLSHRPIAFLVGFAALLLPWKRVTYNPSLATMVIMDFPNNI